jgi:hypothetical protein
MSGLVRIDRIWHPHAFHDGHETRDIVAGIRSWIDIDLRLCVDQPVFCPVLYQCGLVICCLSLNLDH